MQINELTTLNKLKAIKAIRDTTDAPNGAHIDMALQSSLGGRYLGHGVFGAAYEGKKPQHVYKVYNDPTYHEFAKFAKDNHHIYSSLPKIHAIGKTKPTRQTGTTMPATSLGVVKMERLKAIGGSDRDRHLMYLTNMLGAGNMRAKDYPELVNNSQSGRAFASDFPHLHSALSLISKHFPNATLDVHQQNIMKRPGSNEYVLSDPIAGPLNESLDELTTLNKLLKPLEGANVDHQHMMIRSALANKSQHLGNGISAHAWERAKSNSVLRVNEYPSKTYSKFVDYARKNKDDPGLPKISGHKEVGPPNEYASASTQLTKMERLHPLEAYNSEATRNERDYELMGHLRSLGTNTREIDWKLSNPDDYEEARDFKKFDPVFHDSYHKFAKAFPNHTLDLHAGNVMKRENGQYVITDLLENTELAELTTLNKSPVTTKIEANIKAQPGMGVTRVLGGNKAKSRFLGKGVFGAVYKTKNAPESVTKVFKDPAYLDFARYAKDNQDDPHMPRIYSIKHDPKTGISAVRMEKLISSDEHRKATGFYHSDEYHHVANITRRNKSIMASGLDVTNDRLNPNGKYARDVWLLKDKYPTVHDSLSNLASAHPYHTFDIHSGNVMYRPDPTNQFKHTMVFTDPFADRDALNVAQGKKPKKKLMEMITLNKALKGAPSGRLRGNEIANAVNSSKKRSDIDRYLQNVPPDLRSRPHSHNKPLLGIGEFGAVYPSGSHNKVVKIADDPAYHEFARYAMAHPEDPHLPKIHSIKKAGNVAVYRMEKLHYFEPDGFTPEPSANNDEIYGRTTAKTILDDISFNVRHTQNKDVLDRVHSGVDWGVSGHFKRLAQHHPTIATSLHNIWTHFPEHQFDLGSANMMHRHNPDGSKTVVFTDPIYSKDHLMEDEGGETLPTNNVGSGHIAGVGIGPDGEPPVKKSTMLRRKKPLTELTTFNLQNKPETDGKVWYHGSPSGVLVRGTNGIHVGSREAAHEALVQRVGVPADGKPWDGTRKLGETLMAGKNTLKSLGRNPTEFYDLGYGGNRHDLGMWHQKWPEHDYYIKDHPHMHPMFYAERGERRKISLDSKPNIQAYHIVGPMLNGHKADVDANYLAKSVINHWKKFRNLDTGPLMNGINFIEAYPKHFPHGVYYKNDNEDVGSISAIVPHRSWLKPVDKKPLLEMITLNKLPIANAFRSESYPYIHGPVQDHYPNAKRLGNGAFASVYDRQKNDSVIKVYGKDMGGARGGYHAFLQHAKANQDDPHMPRIYASKDISPTVGAVRMERLHPIPKKHPLYNILWQIGTHEDAIHKLAYIPSLSDSFKKLSQHPKAPRMLDVQPANIMLRHNPDGTQTPVITDPWGG